MTDPADRHLEERLHALARGIPAPVVPADEDVRRGRRRLLRMRLAVAGATTGTLAVVLGITSLTAGDPTADEVPPVTQPPSTVLPSSPDSSPSEEGGGRSGNRDQGSAESLVGQPLSTPDTDGDDTSVAGRLPGGGVTSTSTNTATATETVAVDGTATPGHQLSHGPSHGPTTGSADPTPTESTTTTPTEPTETPTSTPTVPPTDSGRIRVHRVLRYYNEVIAEHLDPGRDHLQPYDRTSDTKETTRAGGTLYALGSTYRWDAGPSLDELEVTVASGWDQVEWDCGASESDWNCRASDVAEVARHDGVRQAAVEHADGQVVVITADRTIDSTDDELVAAAADERLTLPGSNPPVSPPLIDSDTFASEGVAALVRAGESFDQTSIDRTPEVRGSWTVDATARGTLSWSAQPVYSGAGWACLRAYRSCTDVAIDPFGTTVHVAALKKRLGGGWVIAYDGPSYVVRVYASDRTFPKKRAYAFVTEKAWQPVR
jgi:hypothetical protein